MTRKDFELIAGVLRNSTALTGAERKTLAWDFVGELRKTNEAFDVTRFMRATTHKRSMT